MHTPPRVFIVDDNPSWREGARLAIGDFCECHLYRDPSVALTAVTELQPDLIVTDNRMEPYSGLELIRRLKEVGFAGPIIMMSLDDMRSQAIPAGAADFVHKFDIRDKMAPLVRRYLSL